MDLSILDFSALAEDYKNRWDSAGFWNMLGKHRITVEDWMGTVRPILETLELLKPVQKQLDNLDIVEIRMTTMNLSTIDFKALGEQWEAYAKNDDKHVDDLDNEVLKPHGIEPNNFEEVEAALTIVRALGYLKGLSSKDGYEAERAVAAQGGGRGRYGRFHVASPWVRWTARGQHQRRLK